MLRLGVVLALLALLAGCSRLSFVGFGQENNEDRRTPLEKAAQEGDAAEVERLLAAGADPDGAAGMSGSALNAAVLGPGTPGNAEVVRILLAAGANPNGRVDEEGRYWVSPLWHAANRGDVESVRALIEAGASIAQRHGSEFNAAWLEAPIANLLVEHGLDLMAVDAEGRNQLHVALAPPTTPQLAGIEYLVRAGVPLDARDHSGKTPLDYWREPRYFETHWIQTWLLERIGGASHYERERESRAEVSHFLERAGAGLKANDGSGQ
jgi:ankyrin repeat protein